MPTMSSGRTIVTPMIPPAVRGGTYLAAPPGSKRKPLLCDVITLHHDTISEIRLQILNRTEQAIVYA
jgi:hypothetical protein